MISKHGIKTLKITGQKKTQVFNRDKGETQYERLSNFLFYGLDLDSVNTFNRTNSINKTLTQEKPDMSNKKYELTKEIKTLNNGVVLHRIRALQSFGNVKEGEFGGWIENEKNLNQTQSCWVSDNAQVRGNAKISDDAQVLDNARISENAQVSDYAQVSGCARISGDVQISDMARVFENARISGRIRISDMTQISGNIAIWGNTWLFGKIQ
jgi:NDP-sugar pyrophosphorylase family protein